MHQHVHMWRSEDTSGILSPVPFIFCLRQDLSLTRHPSNRPDQLASQSPGTLLVSASWHWGYRHVPLCLASYMDLNAGPHAWEASTFVSKLSVDLVVSRGRVTAATAKAWVTEPSYPLGSLCLQKCWLSWRGTVAGTLLGTHKILRSSQHQKDRKVDWSCLMIRDSTLRGVAMSSGVSVLNGLCCCPTQGSTYLSGGHV